MDALDVRILRTMDLMPYGSQPRDPGVLKASHIARQVGTTRDTIKARVEAMEEQGVILGYQVLPNLAHLDRGSEGMLFEPTDDGPVLERVRRVPEVLAIHDYLGGPVCIEFAYRDPGERQARLHTLAERTGDHGPRRFYDGVMPEVERPLSNLDWRILAALRWEAKKSLRRVANEVGVTRRTVKRRLDRMAQEGSFVAYPLLNPGRASGLILFELLFYTEAGIRREAANQILTAFEDQQVFSYVPASEELGNLNILLFAETPAEVDALRRQGRELPGVDQVEAWLFRRFLDESHWLDERVRERIEATAP